MRRAANRESQLALAVHELMQNAVPHSHDEEVDLDLEVEPDADRVEVAVTNRCTEAEFQALPRPDRRMNTEPDALRHYLTDDEETPANVRGGLGLARVRFEAQLELSREPRPRGASPSMPRARSARPRSKIPEEPMSEPVAGPATPLQVADEKYSALLARDVEGSRVVFRGTISTVNPAVVLNPFVDAVHARAREARRRSGSGSTCASSSSATRPGSSRSSTGSSGSDRCPSRSGTRCTSSRTPRASGSARACSRSPATA